MAVFFADAGTLYTLFSEPRGSGVDRYNRLGPGAGGQGPGIGARAPGQGGPGPGPGAGAGAWAGCVSHSKELVKN